MHKDDGVHIGLDVQKFQQCCAVHEGVSCKGDIVSELIVPVEGGHAYYFPFCGRTKCVEVKKRVETELLPHSDPNLRGDLLDMKNAFIRPAGKNYKVKFTIWVHEKYGHIEEEDAPEIVEDEDNAILNNYAADDWEYADEIDCWRDTEGDIVYIRHLHVAELIDAIFTLRDVNFKSMTKKIAWTKKLYLDTSRPRHIYPPTTLKIGAKAASEKLQEFEAVVLFRGLI